ncbi:MAG: hypothetical protein ACFFCE_15970 [Promethearchaeota archaeon]
MKTLNITERGLIAALVISDIVSILLFTYTVIFDRRDMIPIFLIIMPAIYFETKQQLKAEQDQNFQYKKVLWLLLTCLIISEGMNLILYIL